MRQQFFKLFASNEVAELSLFARSIKRTVIFQLDMETFLINTGDNSDGSKYTKATFALTNKF